MTIAEQIRLFNHLTPHEFIEFSLEMKNREIDLPIVWYVKICLKEKSQLLTSKENAFKEKWKNVFSGIDLFDYISALKFPEVTEYNGNEFVKNMFESIIKDIRKNANSSGNRDQGALLKLLEEIHQNIDFSSKDRATKGLGFSQSKFLELLRFTREFTGHRFELKNISIKLTPKQFMHILIGHVEEYLVPRKGMLIPFNHISHWQEVLLLITSVISLLKENLETHFNISKQEYNNTSVILGNKKYGIHISKKGEIKTFYPVPFQHDHQ